MVLNSIEHEWQRFSKMIFRGMNPSPTQVFEMKKAFFAGAWVIVNGAKEVGEPHVSEEEGIEYFKNLEQECLKFHKKLMQEYVEGN